jgi:uncharacterized protein
MKNPLTLTLLRVGLFLFLFVLIAGLTQYAVVYLIAYFENFPPNTILQSPNSFYSCYQQLATCLITLALTSVFWYKIKKQKLSSLGLTWQGSSFAKGTLLGASLLSIGFICLQWGGWVIIDNIQLNGLSLFVSFLMYISVAITEELVCRGVILSLLQDSLSRWVALLITSLLFGVLHLFNPNVTWISLFNISISGVLMGISYLYNRNLMFPIGLHFGWNYFQGSIFGFEVSGNAQQGLIQQHIVGNILLNGGEFGFEGSIFALPLMLITTLGLYFYFERPQNITQQ